MKEKKFTPDFIGIGAPRCGTTWIYDCLSEHPEICTSDIKETNFFRSRFTGCDSLEKYKDHFSHCGEEKIKGEFSSSYFHNKEALRNIKRACPDVKIILSLRNQVDKLISTFYDTNRHKKNITKTDFENFFGDFLNKETFLYSDKVDFILDTFKKDQIHIIIFENLKENPDNIIKNLYSFLGVESNFAPKAAYKKSNSKDSYYFPRLMLSLNKVYKYAKKNHELYLFFKKFSLLGLGEKVTSFFKKRRSRELASNKSFKKKLSKSFGRDTEKLEELLDKDLNHWKEF